MFFIKDNFYCDFWRSAKQTNVTAKNLWDENRISINQLEVLIDLAVTTLCLTGLLILKDIIKKYTYYMETCKIDWLRLLSKNLLNVLIVLTVTSFLLARLSIINAIIKENYNGFWSYKNRVGEPSFNWNLIKS